MNQVFKWLQGRTTAFCVAFFVAGTTLQFLHRLDATYTGFMAVLLGAVLGHSVKEDLLTSATPVTVPPPPSQS